MVPHRLIKQALPTAEVVGFLTVLSTALSVVVNGVNLFLVSVLVVAMLADQAAGMLKAVVVAPKGQPWYDGDKMMRGAAKKGLVIIGVVIAGTVDMVLMHMPGFDTIVEQLTPVSKGALAYFIVGQWASALRNVAVVQEARAGVEFIVRRMDAAKLGHEPPARRQYDPPAVEEEHTLETPDGTPFYDAAHRRDQERHPPEED
jgi:hypothetical protein